MSQTPPRETNSTRVTSGVSSGVLISSLTGGQTTVHTHFTDGILRARLNYQFH